MPKVSVIVPVYNVKEYIEKCLDSICMQTLQDIEIICVDDGSFDGSDRILDKKAAGDSRVKVIHTENAGYGAAMNVGLDMASGEYIGIVESDDYILPKMFESLYEAAAENNLDMVKSDAFYWMETEALLSRIHMKGLDDYYDKVLDELDRNVFFQFYMNIWTGIYKREFLEKFQIKFHESPGASYQDNGFWFQTCIYAEKAMWLNQAFYYYRQDNPTASVKSTGKIMAMTKEYEYIEQLLLQRSEQEFLPYCYGIRLLRNSGTYRRISDEKKLEFCVQIEKDYRIYKAYIKDNRNLNEFFKTLIRNTWETTQRVITIKREILKRVNENKRIVIYGAGLHGDRVFRVLCNEGYSAKVSCFAVTSVRQSAEIAKRPVLFIAEAVTNYPDALYIVAVPRGTNAYKEMTDRLIELQISNILSGSDMEENFYIL